MFDTDADAVAVDIKAALIAEIAAARSSDAIEALKPKIQNSWGVIPRVDYWEVFATAIQQFMFVLGDERFAHLEVGRM